MAQPFKFELVSPERLLVSEQVESVAIPGAEGEMTGMAEHAPVMTTIKPGVVTVKADSGGQESSGECGGSAPALPAAAAPPAEAGGGVRGHAGAAAARRIQEAKEDVADAKDDASRTKAEQFLHQLTTLEGALLPA